MTDFRVRAVAVSTTVADPEVGNRMAASIVEEGLAACVQMTAGVESTYRWKGRVERATEWSLVCKTTPELAGVLLHRLRALHPYETPELLVSPVVGGDPDYLAWLREVTVSPDAASS